MESGNGFPRIKILHWNGQFPQQKAGFYPSGDMGKADTVQIPQDAFLGIPAGCGSADREIPPAGQEKPALQAEYQIWTYRQFPLSGGLRDRSLPYAVF